MRGNMRVTRKCPETRAIRQPGRTDCDVVVWNPTMTEHTKVDFGAERVDGDIASTPGPTVLEKAAPRSERMASNKIECNACPVLCQISEGRTGACDRYANANGVLVRVDPVLLMRRQVEAGGAELVPFVAQVAHDVSGEATPPNALPGE